MEVLVFPVLILVGALLMRSQKLQDDINAMKAQNERIIAALEKLTGDSKSAPNNEGEDTL
jgi:hypothetical protein